MSNTWEEQKVAQALALELIRETSDSSEVQEVSDKLASELETIKKVADKFESAGDLVLKKEATKKSFADELSKASPYSYDEVYAMLTQLQYHWEQDEKNSKNWTIKEIYGNLGKTMDAVEFTCDVIILNEYYRENINAIMPYLPTDSGLYLGFKKLDKMMNYGLETYITTLLRKEVVNELAKSMSDTTLKEMAGASKGALSAASAFYKVMSLGIDQPSIGNLNKAWLSATNTQLLHRIMREKNETIAAASASKRESHKSDHELICTLYFASLKALGKHVIAVQKDTAYDTSVAKDVAYLKQKLDRYSPGLTYSAYISSCKELVAESGIS